MRAFTSKQVTNSCVRYSIVRASSRLSCIFGFQCRCPHPNCRYLSHQNAKVVSMRPYFGTLAPVCLLVHVPFDTSNYSAHWCFSLDVLVHPPPMMLGSKQVEKMNDMLNFVAIGVLQNPGFWVALNM